MLQKTISQLEDIKYDLFFFFFLLQFKLVLRATTNVKIWELKAQFR